jgi:peroxiredoxin
MRLLFFVILLSSFGFFAQTSHQPNVGKWQGQLAMNDRLFVPFRMEISEQKSKLILEIVNGDERISLQLNTEKDSIIARFPELDAYIKFKVEESGNALRGYWLNMNKKVQTKIPLNAWLDKTMTELSMETSNIDGKWKATFSPTSKEPEITVGLFKQKSGLIQGTFLTETGDYRFLAGTVVADRFSMSTFNGSWAFLFEGSIVNDSIYGKFYSGSSYQTDWIAVKDASAALRDPSKLTYVDKSADFNFAAVKSLKGKSIDLKKQGKNKVVIYQIMGTWCPNCIDEIHFFKELYQRYRSQGLEIIGLSYEVGNDEKSQIKRLKAFKKRLSILYEIVLAGTSSKEVASSQFPMLNGIMSFPTAVVVDRTGKIVYVHTGFNGPATGEAYENYNKEMKVILEGLLK